MTKLLIIGGVAGGATAAARARRIDERAEIILFERGEFVSFANCGLPYYIGGVIKQKSSLLVTTSEALVSRYNIGIRALQEVVAIDRAKKEIEVKDLASGKVYRENYDKLILSPGAEPIKPPIEGIDRENIFRLRNIPDSDKIKDFVDRKKPKSAVVIGGGFIGLEMAENLAHKGVRTTVVEMLDQVMAPIDYEMAAIVHDYLRRSGITLELENGVKSFGGKGDGIVVHTTKGNDIECDIAILSIGIRAESKLAKDAGLDLNERGGIRVDEFLRTSDPDIYAIGDAVEIRDIVSGMPTMTALAGPANKQARIAADNALGRKSVFKGTQGTAVVKIFDITVASTGMNEKTLRRNKTPFIASYTHSASHASYYPGAETMAIKILFQPKTGKLLGAQIVGGIGVDKRIDVLATAIRAEMTVFDLEELELAYAPPYGSAKDPVNVAGFVGANIIKGDVEIVTWNEIEFLDPKKDALLDLRNAPETAGGMISGAKNIPLHELRKRLGELDKSQTQVCYCGVGLRSYIGCRILTQNGFKAKNLSGAFVTYSAVKDKVKSPFGK